MKKIIFMTISLVILVGLLSSVVIFAAEPTAKKTIMLGTSDIAGYDSEKGYDYIYYGAWNGEPIKWRVLDDQTNTGETGLFLLSEELLTVMCYDIDGQTHINSQNDGEWLGSTAQKWCMDFAGISGTTVTDAFSAYELSQILATTKSDNEYTTQGSVSEVVFGARENNLNGDKIFLLSVEEATNSAYGFSDAAARVAQYSGENAFWWLRSPVTTFIQPLKYSMAGYCSNTGSVMGLDVDKNSYEYGMRPAFNLNTNDVLFKSAAQGGKPIGVLGTLGAPADYSSNEWKLTILDSSRAFSVNETVINASQNQQIRINYHGALTGSNEYVSAMIVDDSGEILYYGQLANNSASGTADLTVPADLAIGKYTIKVFSEQLNGDGSTDYSSAFSDIALTVSEQGTEQTVFEDINISLGDDLAVNYFIVQGNFTNPQIRFTINGYTETVDGVIENEQFKFVFDGIAPQWIGDTITAELIIGGEVVEVKEYSVLKYLNTLKSKTAAELGISESKYSAMQTLIADLLVYGGAAQNYTGHNTGALVSEGIIGSTFEEIVQSDKIRQNGSYVTFTGATVFFDSVNALKFKFTATDINGIVIKVKVNDGTETEIFYVANGDGTYTITTDAIYAHGFDDVYTVTAYKDGVADASITYSVKSYVYAKQYSTGKIAELVKATYNYGLAAKAYKDAQ